MATDSIGETNGMPTMRLFVKINPDSLEAQRMTLDMLIYLRYRNERENETDSFKEKPHRPSRKEKKKSTKY